MSSSSLHVSLSNKDYWQQFHPDMEVRVDRPGDRQLPDLAVKIEGLDPNALYTVSIHLERFDKFKYKFNKNSWEIVKECAENPPINKKLHENGSISGSRWMKKPVLFSKFYISNDQKFVKNPQIDDPFCVQLNRKYQPVITVRREKDGEEEEFRLEMTEFMAVSRYMNQKIAELKKTTVRRHCEQKRADTSDDTTPQDPATSGSGSPVSPPAKKAAPVHNQLKTPPVGSPVPVYYQNQIKTSPASSPLMTSPAKASSSMGPNNVQHQLNQLTTPPSPVPMHHQNQLMAVTPSTAPSPMAPPAMTTTTPPSHGFMHYQNQMTSPPVMTRTPSVTPYAMAPQNMTPPTMLTNYSTQNMMTPVPWDPMLFQNQMMNQAAMAMNPYAMTQQTMTPPTIHTPPAMFPTPMTPYTMAPQNMAAFPPALDYTNPFWTPYGMGNMPQMGGGAPMAPQLQWNMMHGAGDFQNFAQLQNPGNMPYDFQQHNNVNGSDIFFLQRSSGANYNFRF